MIKVEDIQQYGKEQFESAVASAATLQNGAQAIAVAVGDYTCIAGGVCISGGVSIGPSCYLGTNSSIIGGVSIGEGSLVGMGSVVLRDVAANSVVVGSPARFLRPTRGAPTSPANTETRA